MQKMLCPYCDHEIKGKGKCDFCGSRVKKPVIAEVSAELDVPVSANSGESGSANASSQPVYNSGYDSVSGQQQGISPGSQNGTGAAGSAQSAPRRAVLAGEAVNGRTSASTQAGPPRRAVLASEAVGRSQTKDGSKTVVKVIAAVVIINIILQILLTVLNL